MIFPRRVFRTLTAPQMAVANAAEHKDRVRYWLSEARQGEPELRSTRVSFARAAHRAYLKDLGRAERYARHGL